MVVKRLQKTHERAQLEPKPSKYTKKDLSKYHSTTKLKH